jgi:hypothetical protein
MLSLSNDSSQKQAENPAPANAEETQKTEQSSPLSPPQTTEPSAAYLAFVSAHEKRKQNHL